MTALHSKPAKILGPILISLSAANLNLASAWYEILYVRPEELYYAPLPGLPDYLGLCLSVLLLSLVILAVLLLAGGLPRRVKPLAVFACYVAFLINPLNFLRTELDLTLESLSPMLGLGERVALIVGMALLSGVLVWFHGPTRRVLTIAFLALSPLAFLNVGHAAWQALQLGLDGILAQARPLKAQTSGQRAVPPRRASEGGLQRVVWINFSGLDGEALLVRRPRDYAFPAFDAVLRQAVLSTRAVPPGGHMIQATPSVWLGERLASSEPLDASRLQVRLAGQDLPRPLDTLPHVFKDAEAAGARTAVAGFYHPYCRLFSRYYDYCETQSFATARTRKPESLFEALRTQWRTLTPLWRRLAFIEAFDRARASASRLGPDRRFDFVVIHYPVPHRPFMFDARTREISVHGQGLSYFDNVAAADLALAELMEAMKAAGTWDETALIISSTYGWQGFQRSNRPAPGEATLIVKLPRQREAAVVEDEVSTLVLRDLIHRLLVREIRRTDGLSRFLKDARSGSRSAPQAGGSQTGAAAGPGRAG